MKKYITLILTLAIVFSMCACGSAAKTESAQPAVEEGSGSFSVKCVDLDGAPVAGAKIQACTESSCYMAVSDESGIAAFNLEPDEYEVHVYKAPEGYTADDTVINTTADDTQIEIVFTD